MGVTVELAGVEGLAGLLSELVELEHRSTDYQELLESNLMDEAHQFFVDQFETQGQAGGSPWLPESPYTQRLKAALGYGGKGLLRRTDALYQSLTQRGDPLGVAAASSEGLMLGTEDPVAVLHQEGFGRLPQRELIPDEIPDQYTEHWSSLLLDFVEGSEE